MSEATHEPTAADPLSALKAEYDALLAQTSSLAPGTSEHHAALKRKREVTIQLDAIKRDRERAERQK